MKESYVMAHANILFDDETFAHIAQSKMFLSCLKHEKLLYTSFILGLKV